MYLLNNNKSDYNIVTTINIKNMHMIHIYYL